MGKKGEDNFKRIIILIRLEFRVDPSGIGFDLVNEIPITIGTIPLRKVFQAWPNYNPQPPQYNPPAEGMKRQLFRK